MIEKLIPREKPKLFPMSSMDKPQTVMPSRSPDAEISTSSSSSAAALAVTMNTTPPSNSAIQALFGKKIKSIPPAHLITSTKKEPIYEEKKKDSPAPNSDPEEDVSGIQTPPMASHSPVTPTPVILELKPPIKPLSSNSLPFYKSIALMDFFLASQSNDIAKRAQYYQVRPRMIYI